MIVSVVTFTTVAIVSDVIPGIWRGTVTSSAVPFPLCMACRSTVSCDAIVSYATQLDRARAIVQIVLIIGVTVLTYEALLIHVHFVSARIWRAAVTVSTA